MKKLTRIVLFSAILVGGGWALVNRDQIQGVSTWLSEVQSRMGSAAPAMTASYPGGAAPGRSVDSIRLASFNIQSFGPKKGSDDLVMERLAEVCRQFDLIAIQEIRGQDATLLTRLVQKVNAAGGRYAYVISPPLGRTTYREQAAFVFDQSRILLDEAFAYTVHDPDDLMHRPPFVGWFRAAVPRPDQAFTFTVANVHIDAKKPAAELVYLQNLFRAIRNDGRGEDDIIIAGDFNAGDQGLQHLRDSGLTWAISNAPTNTRFSAQYDNLIFDSRATCEYLGTSGVLSLIKHFNITMDEALDISDHLPVWADFSIYEGFSRGRVAVDPAIEPFLRQGQAMPSPVGRRDR